MFRMLVPEKEMRRPLGMGAILFALLLVSYFIPRSVNTYLLPGYSIIYLVFELLSVVLSALIFSVVWSARNEGLSRHVRWLGTAFLAVSVLDLGQAVAFYGVLMPMTGGLAAQTLFFLMTYGSRLVGTLVLIVMAVLPRDKASDKRAVPVWLPVLLITSLALAGKMVYTADPYWAIHYFISGSQQWNFRTILELLLIVLLVPAGVLFLRQTRRVNSLDAELLFIATCCLCASGVCFFLYQPSLSIYNLIGNFFKILAYLFVYQAIFKAAVQRPYHLLYESRQSLRATLDALPDVLIELDREGRFLDVHMLRHHTLFIDIYHLIGHTVGEVFSSQAARTVMAALQEAEQKGVSHGMEIAVSAHPNKTQWFELSVAHKSGQAHSCMRFVLLLRDITKAVKSARELTKLSSAVEQSPAATMMITLDMRVEFINKAFSIMVGRSYEQVCGRHIASVLHSERFPKALLREARCELEKGRVWRGELGNVVRETDTSYAATILVYPLRNQAGKITHYIVHMEDISERQQYNEKIHQLLHYDQLTGLPNQTLFKPFFNKVMEQNDKLTLICIDLDDFKVVNESFGYTVGDQMLFSISRRVNACLEVDDLLIRYASDEFIVIIHHVDLIRLDWLCQNLLQAVSAPTIINGHNIQVTASIGLSVYPQDSREAEDLLRCAEIATSKSKEEGNNRYCYFTSGMETHVNRMMEIRNALRHAIDNDEFYLVYQPQVSLKDQCVMGAEVLLRWHSPRLGKVSPTEFIPVAESTGLIIEIGQWVLKETLRQLKQWLDDGLPPVTLAVNLSAVQFQQHNIVKYVEEAVEESGVPPECLELELTEAVAMESPKQAARKLQRLNTKGISLAIDDFGTGYSSLAYLKQFKVGRLKIDRSFIDHVDEDEDNQVIVATVIRMAHGLGIDTLAEGVERQAELEFLQSCECGGVQGFYFSKPLACKSFEAFLKTRKVADIKKRPRS